MPHQKIKEVINRPIQRNFTKRIQRKWEEFLLVQDKAEDKTIQDKDKRPR